MAEKFTYPVIFEKADGVYYADIIDFQNVTQGDDFEDAIFMAKDCICNLIYSYRDLHLPIPEPSQQEPWTRRNKKLVLVEVDYDKWLEESVPQEPLVFDSVNA